MISCSEERGDTSDAVRSMFKPDVLLPSQFGGTSRQRGSSSVAERRLLVTLLADAIDCFRKYVRPRNAQHRRLFNEAEAWIMDEDKPPIVDPHGGACGFSFEYVCEVLDLDAEYVRTGLRRWRDTQGQGG